MFGVRRVFVFGAFGLLFKWMQLAISQKHWVLFVFVVMGESVVSLREVKPKNKERTGSNNVLLEWQLRKLCCLQGSFSRQ
jgi:hypothetical protein